MVRLFSCLASLVLLTVLLCGSATAAGEYNYCSKVFGDFLPCISYVGGLSNQDPTGKCCQGIRKLNGRAKQNGEAPKKICQCIEDMTYVMNLAFVSSQVASLQDKCNLNLSFPISNAMDCSK
uniref:Bifunctional inhibitor/plant lipid transfer protein/seed storage helical domain-containing protein n=1 Tax=Manihot esculenta TaxID=3983 RepID=A0A2C9UTT6_MANES